MYKQSTYNKAYKEGMAVDCKYVKRKQLQNYLTAEVLEKYKSKFEEGLKKRKSDTVAPMSPREDSPEANKRVKRDSECTPGQVRFYKIV